MFIVSIYGGIGSQMDQYALYLALKKRYPSVLIKLEINNIIKPDHNGFELKKVFGIDAPEATLDEIIRLSDIYPYNAPHYSAYRVLYGIRRKILGTKKSWIMPKDTSAFYPEIFSLDSNKSYMFYGNWTNEEYTKDIINEIYDIYKFPHFTDKKNIELAERIKLTNSVSIHVRHGDYKIFGLPMLDLEYYKKAIDIISEKIKSPHFFIFSDDIDFVNENFHFLDKYTIINWNKSENSYRDMQLMSLCKHNIIANSTFSYWGARLNRNKEKVVIAPKKHVESCKYPLACSDWIIIDNTKF